MDFKLLHYKFCFISKTAPVKYRNNKELSG